MALVYREKSGLILVIITIENGIAIVIGENIVYRPIKLPNCN
jgi:hypothetical protein